MGLVTSSIPNLIGGVSQQAVYTRSRNTSEYELNTLHSLVSGLNKRPSSEYVSKVYDDNDTSKQAVMHPFETADGTKFLLVIDVDTSSNTRAKVVRASDGKDYSISLSNDNGYISGTSDSLNSVFSFLSVGDTTFILNKSVNPSVVPVTEDSSTGSVDTDIEVQSYGDLPDPNNYPFGTTAHTTDDDKYYVVEVFDDSFSNELGTSSYKYWDEFNPSTGSGTDRENPDYIATVFVRQAVHATQYSATITQDDGTQITASYTTPDSVDGNGDPVEIDTGMIVSNLVSTFNGNATLTATQRGSTLSIKSDKKIRKIFVRDEFGDQAMRGYTDRVDNFNDLPPNEVDGRIVRISGSADTNGDDYYVEFDRDRWEETVAFGSRSTLRDETMPMALVYDPVNDSFTLSTNSWPGRTSGDKDSNPDPAFVGRPISGMFLFKGRMCFLADENIIFSEVGYFENFYRTTLTLLLETDPIDVAATTAETAILHHGIPFDRTLIIFSDNQQFRVISGDSLTPQNISIVPTTTYNSSRYCRPIAVGSNIFFAEDYERSRYGSVMEYFRNPNNDSDSASPVTSQVPKYIPNEITTVDAASNEMLVAALTKENNGDLFVYRYFWSGAEKVLSSWTKWSFSGADEVIAISFFGDTLYALIRDDDGIISLVRCDIEEGRFDDNIDFHIHLDFRIKGSDCSPSYSSTSDETQYSLPYGVPDGADVVAIVSEDHGDYPAGTQLQVSSVSGSKPTLVNVDGDQTGVPVFIGLSYEAVYDFTRPLIRARQGNGEIVVQQGRLSLRYMTLFFDETSSFKVKVTHQGRTAYESTYTPRSLGSTAQTDKVNIDDGKFRFSCKGNTETTSIRIINDTPFPSAFISAEWEGFHSPKARRI